MQYTLAVVAAGFVEKANGVVVAIDQNQGFVLERHDFGFGGRGCHVAVARLVNERRVYLIAFIRSGTYGMSAAAAYSVA